MIAIYIIAGIIFSVLQFMVYGGFIFMLVKYMIIMFLMAG
jgi:hypothetical protein